MGRDNFTKTTTEVLAKRVSYLCSNPNCRKLTIGANENPNKSTLIGEAAHITAASPEGPRYNGSLTEEQRRHIENGIWLCCNCATLIDKDESKYTVDFLKKWKGDAEQESKRKLGGEIISQPMENPYLEVDLIWTTTGRINAGYSNKNPIEMHEGQLVRAISSKPIIHWKIFWSFNFVIYNNSNYPAYNVKIESIGEEHFKQLGILPKVNNIPPLKNLDLKARYEDFIEGNYLEAEQIMKSKIPPKFKDIKLKLTYYDNMRNLHTNNIEFSATGIINKKL